MNHSYYHSINIGNLKIKASQRLKFLMEKFVQYESITLFEMGNQLFTIFEFTRMIFTQPSPIPLEGLEEVSDRREFAFFLERGRVVDRGIHHTLDMIHSHSIKTNNFSFIPLKSQLEALTNCIIFAYKFVTDLHLSYSNYITSRRIPDRCRHTNQPICCPWSYAALTQPWFEFVRCTSLVT